MQIEESLIVDIADMSCIWNHDQRHVITSVLDGLLYLRQKELVVLTHQIESRNGNVTGIVRNLSKPYFDASSCSVYHYNPAVKLAILDCLIM